MTRFHLFAMLFAALISHVASFHTPCSTSTRRTKTTTFLQLRGPLLTIEQQISTPSVMFSPSSMTPPPFLHARESTALSMYNLPQSGGGGRGGGGGGNDIIPQILGIVGLVLFFVSPLGGIFFAITNSLFVLALITPVILVVGFNIWKSFNIVEGTCPSCASPVAVLKNDNDGLGVAPCLNCGATVRATKDGKGVELCNPNPDFDNLGGGGDLFEDLFGGMMGGPGGNQGMGRANVDDVEITVEPTTSKTGSQQSQKRQGTVIDVDVLDD
mmetsp:Transcript_24874/g.36501  ORF Transcript_24874/g.36501 Transcript_24874/m.36501 type:complete len:270 (-) Transcript_24874:190-999(-)|eukprot:CAMPEP_0195525154 /NCGR_PEP_ID=MMETSP0794_2-20130614/25428_1 /TAXON_ID=515487 /ORGANISM="Stephanopyxis turris, Strain CCMP 815" /LENGTH=269 /DNA_ID=CAMNT_0040655537 /DNA_START=242 /DNA_END=1051 /DNA_ORIENTATION=-